ncbi:MAG: hypothetical protein EBX37_08630 [Alphaproteobacteria bacterium]|nr:hypothetical protein [Alphaproteobacteria bacterium]
MNKNPVKKTRDVVHEVFYEASQHIDDEFWKNFFIDLSKNKLGRKIHIDDKHVSHVSKRMNFSYNYEGKRPQEIASELRKIISNTMCIYSDIDMTNEAEGLASIVNEFKEAKTEDDWKKVKNKKMKDHLITNFIINQKNKYQLKWSQAKDAYDMVTSALYLFRSHKSADINMVNGEIESIDDIVITATEIANRRVDDCMEEDEVNVVKKITLDKEWDRLCTNVAKRAKVLLCDHDDDETIKKKAKTTSKKATKGRNKSKQVEAEEDEDEGENDAENEVDSPDDVQEMESNDCMKEEDECDVEDEDNWVE